MKEGYTKAIGTGISFGLERINVQPGVGMVSKLEIDGRDARSQGWRWAVGSLDGAYGWAVIWNEEEDQEVIPEPLEWSVFARSFIGQD